MSQFRGVSQEIKDGLREEGVVFTNFGIFRTPAEEDIMEAVPEKVPETDIDPKILAALTPDQKRTMSILLQSSMKIAADLNSGTYPSHEAKLNSIKIDSVDLALWVDRNSTRMIPGVYEWKAASQVKK
jgi:hypothetical protein